MSSYTSSSSGENLAELTVAREEWDLAGECTDGKDVSIEVDGRVGEVDIAVEVDDVLCLLSANVFFCQRTILVEEGSGLFAVFVC